MDLAELGSSAIDGGLSVVDSAAKAGIQQAFTNYNRNEDYKVWKKMNNKVFQQSQEAQKNSAANMAESYRRAGLSTALLAGGNFTPAANQSATSPSHDPQVSQSILSKMTEAAQLDNIREQNSLLKAQVENLEAGTDKTRSETKIIEFKFKNDSDYRDMLTSWVQGEFGNEYNEWAEKHPDLVNNGEKMNGMAFLMFHTDAMDKLLRDTERDIKFDQASFDGMVANIRKYSKELASDVASLPTAQRDEIYARITNLSVMNSMYKSVEQSNFAKTDETRQKIENLRAEFDKTLTQTADMLINSPALAQYKGDKRAAALGMIQSAIGYVGDLGKAAVYKK